MDPALTIARHAARLLWLLRHEPTNVDDQKATLRALTMAARERAVTLAVVEGKLVVDGAPVAEAFQGVPDLVARLQAHDAQALALHEGATPADLLGALRLVAGAPDASVPVDERLRAAGAATARLVPRSDPRPAPPAAAPAERSTLEFELVAPEDVPAPKARESGNRPPTGDIPIVPGAPSGPVSGMFEAFATASVASAPDRLLGALDAAPSDADVTAALDRLVQGCEQAEREGRGTAVAACLAGMVARESGAPPERRRSYGMALRRMGTPRALAMVAGLLAARPEQRDALCAVLQRVGTEGADAVIEQLTRAQTAEHRRVFYDVLASLPAGVESLVHMLGDARWYVARNAAELLGEMHAEGGVRALARAVQHADERVRRAAMDALLAIDTREARDPVYAALAGPQPVVRAQAAQAIGGRRDATATPTLLRALDAEQDDAAQRALLAALGCVATPDAVARLIQTAEPARGIFKRKAPEPRIAAVHALAEARTPAALEALRALVDDKDRQVKDAAARAFALALAPREKREVRVTGAFDAIR